MSTEKLDQLMLRRILRALGIGVLSVGHAGCDSLSMPRAPGESSVSPPDSSARAAGGAGAPSSAASAGTGGSTGGRAAVGGAVPAAGAAGAPVMPSAMAPLSCPPQVSSGNAQEDLMAMPQCLGATPFVETVCVQASGAGAASGSGGCEATRPDDDCLLRLYSCGLSSSGDTVVCGPITTAAGDCCYLVDGKCLVGRPFLVDGVARLSKLAYGAHWCEPSAQSCDGLSREIRAALADVWRQDGLFEHASVASFSRFALQLLAHGAPAALVDGALRAARDEVRHARLCFGLAAAYAGAELSPTSLRTDDALAAGTGATLVAASLAAEGCVAETVSAQLIAAAAQRAIHPAVREVLEAVARDEAEHVELAWKALGWLLGRGDREVRHAVAAVFSDAPAHVGFGARTERDVPESIMADHGYLSIPVRRQIAAQTLRSVVLPAARLLLADEGRAHPRLAGSCELG